MENKWSANVKVERIWGSTEKRISGSEEQMEKLKKALGTYARKIQKERKEFEALGVHYTKGINEIKARHRLMWEKGVREGIPQAQMSNLYNKLTVEWYRNGKKTKTTWKF